MKHYLLSIALILFYFSTFSQGIDKPQYQIVTHRAGSYLGTFNIELFPLIAPLHVNNFDSLVGQQFYDSTAFHRVVPGFVIQGGDPNSINGPISTWGQGQPWQPTVPAEFNAVRHLRGILGAARDTDINSANSQFYICVANATFLDGNYTVYGKVTSGMDVVDTIVNSPRDANDVPLQKIEMFITYTGVNDSVPGAPTLTAPADGATGILNTQNFIWSAVDGAVLYTAEFSTDPAFSVVNISRNSGTNSTIVPDLEGSTLYYWRVKSNNGGHESAYSNVFSFTSATAAPDLLYPTDTLVGVSIDPVFSWSPVPNATSYTLQVSTSSTFTTQTMVYNTAGITGTSQQVNGLNPNSTYYWRVRSANGTTQGFYSVKFSFTTGTSTSLNEFSLLDEIAVYPNPAINEVTVDAYMKDTGDLIIYLSDKLGKVVYHRQEKLNVGIFSKVVETSHYDPGHYFLTVVKDGVVQVRKIEIRK
jgi:peptidyl-prolyl cis-trans isomerase B (cyclophilin B)